MQFNYIRKNKLNFLKTSGKIIGHSRSSGITLVEMLLAAAFSGFVISGATFGVVKMMERNVALQDRSQTRVNLDRALNYIADDIKLASDVEIVQSGSSFPGSGTGVLLLTTPDTDKENDDPDIPNINGTVCSPYSTCDAPHQVVYFIRPSTSTWREPNTINRDTRENYNNPVIGGEVDGDLALIDGITEPDSSELERIQGECDIDENGTTDLEGANGFYACIDEDTNSVELYLYGEIKEGYNHTSILPLSVKVSTRAASAASPSPSPSESPSPSPSESPSPSPSP